MIDRRAELDCLRPARYRRKHDDRIGAVGFAFPERAEPDLLREHDQSWHVRRRIVRRGIDFNIVNHVRLSSSFELLNAKLSVH